MLGLLIFVFGLTTCFAENGNVTCRTEPSSRCFLGKCPTDYTCLPSGDCCLNSQVVLPPEECKDFMDHCEILHCDHVDFVEFARANCAKTCNYCFENSELPPEYSCTDLLDDCNDRMGLCRDKDFLSMMAVYCPRSCMLCTHPVPPTECQELVDDCSSPKNFCTTTKTSAFQKRMGCGKTCGMC